MSHWVRLWSDMPTDPKWRVIARRAGRPLSEVIAVFVFMMTNAGANATERGELSNWSDEDVAAALDTEAEHVAAIREAMQGKTLDGDRLSGWDIRQPKREDNSADRARAWREKQKALEYEKNEAERKRTQANAPERPDADTDTDKNKNTPQRASRSLSADEFGELVGKEFDGEFWPLYPHKVDRKQAAAKFIIIRRKHSLTAVMDGLRTYIVNKPDWQQWKSPAAWLNGEKFLDCPAAATGPPQDLHPFAAERQNEDRMKEYARRKGLM